MRMVVKCSREEWVKLNTCKFCVGSHLHSCTGYDCREAAKKAEEYFEGGFEQMGKVKTCPFCGGQAEIKVNEQTLNAKAYCERCDVVMKRNFKGSKRIKGLLEELMTEEWNRRQQDNG